MPKIITEAERERKRRERNEKKKQRYRDDPEYRRKCFEAAYRYRAKKRKERGEKVDPPRPPEYQYRIGDVANVCNRAVTTIRDYHSRGVIPEPLVTSRGWRYYTKHQIDLLERVFGMLDRKAITPTTLKKLIHQEW